MNIFLQLSRWAKRQGENFATDSLAIVLSEVASTDPGFCAPILELLTDGLFGIEDLSHPSFQIVTQRSEGEGFGTPDMRIESKNKLALIEVKTGAPLGKDQLLSYRQALEASALSKTRLILLTQYLTPLGKHTPDHSVMWYQIAQCMSELLQSMTLSQSANYLVERFLEYLRSKNLALRGVRSEISESINTHQIKHEDKSILFKRIKSLNRIAAHEELKPLHNILQLMGSVLDQMKFDPKPRLDSGQQTGGWIGYNILRMKYWFCLYFTSSDVLAFETQLWKGERQPSAVPPMGEYYFRWDATYWRNTMDLSAEDGKFFSLPSEEQFDNLHKFFEKSYSIALSKELVA